MNPNWSQIERNLTSENRLHEQYIEVIEEERKFTIQFKRDKLQKLVEKRERLVEQMKDAHMERLRLMSQIPDSNGKKLSELVEIHCSGEQKVKLLHSVAKLKSLALEGQRRTREHGSIVKFALGVVDGLVSIFWSATQHISKSYSRKGIVQESAQPAGTRQSSVLKKA